jgi:Domain of unknown function (DUF2760)
MRLVIIGILAVALNYIFFYRPADFPFDFSELKLLVFALGGVIFVEGILSMRKALPVKSGNSALALDNLNFDYESLRLQIMDLGDSFRNSNETINSLRQALTHSEKKLQEFKSAVEEDLVVKDVVINDVNEGDNLSTANEAQKLEINSTKSEIEDFSNELNSQQQVIALLSVLQAKGRLIDFLMQDINKQEDTKIVAVAKYVHQGCRQALSEHFKIKPVYEGQEGEKITLEASYNPLEYKLSGKVGNQPPFNGKVVHRGWLSLDVNLPKSLSSRSPLQVDSLPPTPKSLVITPAEIDIG